MTAQNSHIVREFDTPIDTVSAQVPTRPATDADGKVLVEDSITHQAGDGITAGMSPSMETPDIFDNSPQAAVKPQTPNQALNDAVEVPIDTVNTVPVNVNNQTTQRTTVQQVPTSATLDQTVEGANKLTPVLDTLPDGSVDIPRNES